jgi:hypothetical protein
MPTAARAGGVRQELAGNVLNVLRKLRHLQQNYAIELIALF